MGIRKPKEGDLVKQCLQWLQIRHPRGVFWRCNSGATKIGDRFIRFGSMPGVSDIIGVIPVAIGQRGYWIDQVGKFIAVECKMPKGRLQPSQQAFIEAVQAAGGIAGVVRSIEDLKRLVGES